MAGYSPQREVTKRSRLPIYPLPEDTGINCCHPNRFIYVPPEQLCDCEEDEYGVDSYKGMARRKESPSPKYSCLALWPGTSLSSPAGCFTPRARSRSGCSEWYGMEWGQREGVMVSSKGLGDLNHNGLEEEWKALSQAWMLGQDLLSPPTALSLILPCTAQKLSVLFLPSLLLQLPQLSFPWLQLL